MVTMTFETSDQDASRLAVLGHPLVVVCLVGWIANDWYLKRQYGNVITGKLSDVCAMVVFPLLLAVVFARFTKRAGLWATGVTGLFFSSINLLDVVDRSVESCLSLFFPSELTKDPTDLIVLPVMSVAVWLWNHPQADAAALRRRAGRVVFAAGALASMATAGDGDGPARTERFSGTFVLTAENPELSMPIDFRLDGEAADPILSVSVDPAFYGIGPEEDLPWDLVVFDVDRDAITFRLTDPEWSPVEVPWSIHGYGILDDSCAINCDSKSATLTVEAPADEFIHDPNVLFSLPEGEVGELMVAQVVISFDKNEPPFLVFPSRRAPEVATYQATIGPYSGRSNLIPVPRRCGEPCEVSIWMTYESPNELGDYGLFGEVDLISVQRHELVRVDAPELVVTLPEVYAPNEQWYSCLKADVSIDNPVDELLTFAGTNFMLSDRTTPPERERVRWLSEDGCVARNEIFVGREWDQDTVRVIGSIWTLEKDAPDEAEIVVTKP